MSDLPENFVKDNYMSVTEFANKYHKDVGYIRKILKLGKIKGEKIGDVWVIPKGQEYPRDARYKSGKYTNQYERYGKKYRNNKNKNQNNDAE